MDSWVGVHGTCSRSLLPNLVLPCLMQEATVLKGLLGKHPFTCCC